MAKTMEEVLERFRTIEFHDDFDMIVAIANGGIVPAGIINQRLQKEVRFIFLSTRNLSILTSGEKASCWWTTV